MLFVFRIDEVYPSQFSSIVELWLLDSPVLLFGCFRHANPNLRPHIFWQLLGSLSGAHQTTHALEEVSHSITWISWILSTNLTKFANSRWYAFLASHPDLYELIWSRQCFFSGIGIFLSAHNTELNSRFNVLTIDRVTFNRPKVSLGFSVIFCFCLLRPFLFALKFSTESFAPHRLFPPLSGFSEFVISDWQFCGAICYWEQDFFSPLWRQHFFCIDSSRMDFWCVHVFQSLNVCDQNVSFPNSSRDHCIAEEYAWQDFLTKIGGALTCFFFFAEIGKYSTITPKWITGPWNGSPNRLSCGVFPSARRSWTFRR